MNKLKNLSMSESIILKAKYSPKSDAIDNSARFCYKMPELHIKQNKLRSLSPSEIQVKMMHVGVCGTDIHMLTTSEDGYVKCSCFADIPEDGRILGHEGVGVVQDKGSAIEHIQIGDLVAFESIGVCNYCRECRRGHFNQCKHSYLLGITREGLFAEIVTVEASLAHIVNDFSENLVGLACLEPAAVSYLACENGQIKPGESVAVIGAGPIGIYAAQLASANFGASRVYISEPIELRRKIAKKVCSSVIHPEQFDELPDFDVLIDAAGDHSFTSATIKKLNNNGRIVLLARTGHPLNIDLVDQIISKSLKIIGSRGHLGGAMDAVLSLVRENKMDLMAPVTGRVLGLDGLMKILENPEDLIRSQCKVIATL